MTEDIKQLTTQFENESKENIKNKNEVQSIIYSLRPVFIFERLFGIFRFHITENGLLPTIGKLKIIGILITSIQVAIFCYCLRSPGAPNSASKVINAMDEVPAIVNLFQFVTSVIVTCILHSQRNVKIITELANLDARLHINTKEDFYKTSHMQTITFIIILTVYHLIVSFSDVATDEVITLKKIVVLPIYFEENLEILVFCLMIRMLRRRLVVINKYLTNFVKSKKNSKKPIYIVGNMKSYPEDGFNFIGRTSHNNMKIRDLAVAYDIIGETCYLINQVFNYQLFMTLVSTFTYIVITIFTSLYYYRNDEQISGAMITIIIWCITAMVKVAVMSCSCEILLVRRNDTKILVNKMIMDYELPKFMRLQAKAFMDLIEAWPLRVFVYDMFSVDITLMLEYISVATTYLIVIIQVSHFI